MTGQSTFSVSTNITELTETTQDTQQRRKANINKSRMLTLLGAMFVAPLLLTPLIVPAYADITLTEASSLANPAVDLAANIMGEGITINSAVYRGGNSQAAIFTKGLGLSFGDDIISFNGGVIFSTGRANTIEGPNTANAGINAVGGVVGDADFDALAGTNTLNATWLEIDFTPTPIPNTSVGDIGRITMNIVLGSEEYNESVYGGVNDTMAIIVNGENKAVAPNGLDFGIDTINDASNYPPFNGLVANDPNPEHVLDSFESANPAFYRNNTDGAFNTQMNGFTVTIPVTFNIVMGQSNLIKIGIADAGDFRSDSWLLVKENSGQTVVVAEDDALETPTNAPFNIDVLANDYDKQGDPLTIFRINNLLIKAGETINLATGISVKLEADNTLTVSGDGVNTAHDIFTYEMTDGKSGSSLAFVDVQITEVDNDPPEPTISLDTITDDNIINLDESTTLVNVTGTVTGEFIEGDTVTLLVNSIHYTGTVDATGKYSITVPGSELRIDASIEVSIATTDPAGNEGGGSATHTHIVDVLPPSFTVTVADVTSDNVINLSESQAIIPVTGTVIGEFSEGDVVTLLINGNTYNGIVNVVDLVNNEGAFSIDVPGSDLDADLSIEVSLTTTDGAGNSGSASITHNHTQDKIPPVPTITVSNITTDNIISISESETTIDVSGTVAGEFSSGDTVTLSINSKTYMGTIDGVGLYSIPVIGSDLVADLLIDASVVATDGAGNTGSGNTTHHHIVDTTLPVPTISVDVITDDNIINKSESETTINVTGTVAGEFSSGDTVTLTVNGKTYTGLIDNAGLYAISVPGSDLIADLEIEVSITTRDIAGNTGTTELTHSHVMDVTTPALTVSVNDITDDNIINKSESETDITVTGTVTGEFSSGDTVTLTVNGNAYAGLINNAGLYAISVPGSDLATDLAIEVSITTRDSAGNTGTAVLTHSHTMDITTPALTISVNDITDDNIINFSESSAGVAVTGMVIGDFSSGDTVTLAINGKTYAGTVNSAGQYLIMVIGSDLVADLEIEASMAITDAAGNTGVAEITHTHELDTTAPVLTLFVNNITPDNVINESESQGDVEITGVVTGDYSKGDTVTLTVNGKTYTGVVTGAATGTANNTGTYSIQVAGSDLAQDPLIEISMTTTDSAGNTVTAETTHSHAFDTTAPVITVSVNSITADNVINKNESETDINVTGSVTGDFSTGDIVSIAINGKTVTGTLDSTGHYSILVAGSDLVADLVIEVSIRTTDSAGNAVTVESIHEHTFDVIAPAPILSVNNITDDNIINLSESNAGVPVTGMVTADFSSGDTVTLAINGKTYAGTVNSAGQYLIMVIGSDLVADLEIEASMAITDAAGNTGVAEITHTHELDTTAPVLTLFVNNITPDNVINESESQGDVEITGVVTGDYSEGDTVTLTVNGKTYTGVVTGAATGTANNTGTYSIQVAGSDLAQDPLIEISMTTTDSAGNTVTAETTHSHAFDTTAPVITVSVNPITADNVINKNESETDINVTGSVTGDFSTGDIVSIAINGKTVSGTLDSTGHYSILVAGSDLVADLVIEVSITTTDSAGNAVTVESIHEHTFDIIAPAPTLSVNNITDDNIINRSESSAGVAVTGMVTGDFSSGDTVTLAINGKTYAGTVNSAGQYLIMVIGSDLVADLEIEASMAITDAAGNTGVAEITHSHELDTTDAALTLSVNNITADNVINESESQGDVEVSGIVTGDYSEGDTVTLTVNGKTYTGVVTGAATGTANNTGTYSIQVAGSDLAQDPLIEISMTTTDSAGNTVTAETTHSHAFDITAPVVSVSVNPITADNVINKNESETDINVTGAASGEFLAGDVVTLMINGNTYTHSIDSTGDYVISVPGFDLATDLTIDASVSTTDDAGNIGLAAITHSHTLDADLPGIPQVDSLITENSTPVLTGAATLENGDTITVTVGGATYTVVPDSNNDWSIDTATVQPESGIFTPNIDGVANEVTATITSAMGNASEDSSKGELTIDNLTAADDYAVVVGINGSNSVVNVLANDNHEGAVADIDKLILTQNSSTDANLTLDTATGVISVVVGTAEDTYTLEYEVCEKSRPDNCDTATVTVNVLSDLDGDGVADDLDLDRDNDGIPDTIEQATAKNAGDTDNDGLFDEEDLDADGDGIADLVESGMPLSLVATLDKNGDGVIDGVVGDNGLADALETDDTGNALLINAPINSDNDAQADYQDLDSDNDSIHDLIEGSGLDPLLVDVDNNGVLDTRSSTSSSGNDGSDNTGNSAGNSRGNKTSSLVDELNTQPIDLDSDGIPNYRDVDADGDGIYDLLEAKLVDAAIADIDKNGLLDNPPLDSDSDGIPDSGDTEDSNYGDPQNPQLRDSDGDNRPDYLDLDSDNDSLPDTLEAGNQDDDKDGLLDAGGSINLTPPDTDNDGFEDFRDVDSDGDQNNDIDTTALVRADVNGDGRVDDMTDDDHDGIANIADGEPDFYGTDTDIDKDGVLNSNDLDDDNDGLPDLSELDSNGRDVDTDSDGIVDRLDRDSDNDGIPDTIEAVAGTQSIDVNGDGVIDNFVDDNQDGLHDSVDAGLIAVDTDSDKIPDFRDLDTDNDTLYDLYEASLGKTGVDANNDGRLDALIDTRIYVDKVDTLDLQDSEDTNVSGVPSGIAYVIPDTDNDGIYDFRDTDADGDEILDVDESGKGFNNPLDTNKNGIDDYIEALSASPASNSNGNIETAVKGVGGSFNLYGLMVLLSLLVLRRYGRFGGKKENAVFLVLSLFLLGLMNRVSANNCSWGSLEAEFKPCVYVGGGAVSSNVDPENGTNGWATSNSSSSGFNLFAGYHFRPHLFAEFGYTDMGEATIKNSFDITAKESISYKVPSLHLGYVQRTPIEQVSVYGKAGVSAIQNKTSSNRISHKKQTSAQLSYGLGAHWQGKNSPFFARLGADFHDKDATATHLNIGYKFAAKRAPQVKTVPEAQPIPAALPNIRPRPIPKQTIDTDGDGYPDNIDYCPLSKRGAVVDGRGCEFDLPKRPTFSGVLEGVNFHTDSDVLTARAKSILRNVSKQFKRWPDLKVIIAGHTDNVGTDQYNMNLSMRRAKSVTNFLLRNGVKRGDILSSVGRGEREPRATNNSETGRAMNRRVELLPQ